MTKLMLRTNFDDVVKDALDTCQYKEYPIKVVGSASLLSQQYFGDFDALTAISTKETAKNIYDEFNNIFKSIDSNTNLYFIEFKVQTAKNKIRYYREDKLNYETIKSNYADIIFFKLDLSVWTDYHFVDFSVIYNLFTEKLSLPYFINGLNKDIEELVDNGQYYKALKRKYSVYKLRGDNEQMNKLNEVFNSDLGLKYKVASNLEAMDLVKEHYKDELTRKRMKINLDYLKLYDYNLKDLMKHTKVMKKEINAEAKEIFDDF